jgi:hypothetical protein
VATVGQPAANRRCGRFGTSLSESRQADDPQNEACIKLLKKRYVFRGKFLSHFYSDRYEINCQSVRSILPRICSDSVWIKMSKPLCFIPLMRGQRPFVFSPNKGFFELFPWVLWALSKGRVIPSRFSSNNYAEKILLRQETHFKCRDPIGTA